MLNYIVLKQSDKALQMRLIFDIVYKVFIIVTTFKNVLIGLVPLSCCSMFPSTFIFIFMCKKTVCSELFKNAPQMYE